MRSSSAENDVIDRDKNEFDGVSDHAHNEETHNTGVEDLQVLFLIRFFTFYPEVDWVLAEFLNNVNNTLLLFSFGHLSLLI